MRLTLKAVRSKCGLSTVPANDNASRRKSSFVATGPLSTGSRPGYPSKGDLTMEFRIVHYRPVAQIVIRSWLPRCGRHGVRASCRLDVQQLAMTVKTWLNRHPSSTTPKIHHCGVQLA